MVPPRSLVAALALLLLAACARPVSSPVDAARQAAASLPETQRNTYVEGFQNGAAMIQIALKEGRKPYALRPGGVQATHRLLGPLPAGVAIVEEKPVQELDPATGLLVRGLPGDPDSPYAQGQLAGFNWGLSLWSGELAARHLTQPRPLPQPPAAWTRWEDRGDRTILASGFLSTEVAWLPGALVWETTAQGFPPQRRWRPSPAWLRPLYVALQPGALWVETRGMGAVALDLESGAILATLPAQAHPAQDGFTSYEDYVASERRKLQEPAQAAKLARLREEAAAGKAEAMFKVGQMLALSDDEPDGLSPRIVWTLEAARRGHVQAMMEMASFYYGGRGLVRDEQEAHRWLERAVATGNPLAAMAMKGMFPGDTK